MPPFVSQSFLERSRLRLRSNYRLSVIMAVCTLGTMSLLPIIVLRLSRGEFVIAAIDSLLVFVSLLIAAYAWKSDHVESAANTLAVFMSFTLVALVPILGKPWLYWYFTLIMFNFGLLSASRALLLNLCVLGALSWLSDALSSIDEQIPFVLSSLTTFAFAFAVVYRAELQHKWLEHNSLTDPLTGIPNRRALTQQFAVAFGHYERFAMPFGLLLLDLDHFKRINDTAGHEAGDEVLKRFARLLSESTRKDDRLFRYGGEEFVIILANVRLDDLETVANTICRLVAGELNYAHDGKTIPITVSIGASLMHPYDNEQDWLQRADKALYMAKNAGRNRTVIYERSARNATVPTANDD